jgi:hypothetical protein
MEIKFYVAVCTKTDAQMYVKRGQVFYHSASPDEKGVRLHMKKWYSEVDYVIVKVAGEYIHNE